MRIAEIAEKIPATKTSKQVENTLKTNLQRDTMQEQQTSYNSINILAIRQRVCVCILCNTHLEMHEKSAKCFRMSSVQHMQRVYVCMHRTDCFSINEYIFYNKKFAERRSRMVRAAMVCAPTDGAYGEFCAQRRTYTYTPRHTRNSRSSRKRLPNLCTKFAKKNK